MVIKMSITRQDYECNYYDRGSIFPDGFEYDIRRLLNGSTHLTVKGRNLYWTHPFFNSLSSRVVAAYFEAPSPITFFGQKYFLKKSMRRQGKERLQIGDLDDIIEASKEFLRGKILSSCKIQYSRRVRDIKLTISVFNDFSDSYGHFPQFGGSCIEITSRVPFTYLISEERKKSGN
jgi:hypothetical protein